MASFQMLLIASAAAAAQALQQGAQPARETLNRGFPTVSSKAGSQAQMAISSKMDELHAGLAKVRADSLNAMTEQKAEFESKLGELLKKSRDIESTNAGLAEDVSNLRKRNLELRANASDLSEDCTFITAELEALRSNISMVQEFIAKSVNSTGSSLGSPELQVLTDLDNEDATAERERHHDKRLSDLQQLASMQAIMIQLDATEKKPATESLVQELLSSWDSISNQQNVSRTSLKLAFDEEQKKCDQRNVALLKEQVELNSTKQTEVALNVKLQGAVAHLMLSHTHLLEEHVALVRFAKRLGDQPIRGEAPPPVSLSLLSNTQASETPGAGGLKAAAAWAARYIDTLR